MDLSLIDSRFYSSDSEKEKAYLMIADIFVAEDDMPKILEFCKNQHARVTFRETGRDSIRQLKRGAGAKSHDILEKSIKWSRLRPADKTALEKIVGKDKLDLVLGLVGRWKSKKYAEEEQGRLKGLYTTATELKELPGSMLKKYGPIIKPPNPFKNNNNKRQRCIIKLALTKADKVSMRKNAAKKAAEASDPKMKAFLEGPNINGKPGYYASHKLTVKFLRELTDEKEGEKIVKYLFGGDYDLHDLLTNFAVTQGSDREKKLLEKLNEYISKSGHRLGTLKDKAHLMIQHGAQANYVANIRNNEKEQPIVENVAKMCEDALVACTPNGWRIVKGFGELSQIYAKAGQKIKSSWASDHEDNVNVKEKETAKEEPKKEEPKEKKPSAGEVRRKSKENFEPFIQIGSDKSKRR